MIEAIKGIFLYSESVRDFDVALISMCREKLSSLYPGVPVYSNRTQLSSEVVAGSIFECIESVTEKCCREDRDTLAFFPGISPLLDASLAGEAFGRHSRYLSHYTFSENIPPGIIPDFLSLEFIGMVPADKKKEIKTWKDLRAFAFKNIDDYDLEIFYKSPDLRQYRMDFTCENDRSEAVVKSVVSLSPSLSYADLRNFILKNPEVIRPAPSYIEISVTEKSPVSPSFLPQRQESSDAVMSGADMDRILSELENHPFVNDLTVSLAGPGEPVLYEGVCNVMDKILSMSQVKTLYLETFGTSFRDDMAGWFRNAVNPGKLHVIFRLTTLDAKRYLKLYGSDLLDDVLKNIELVKSSNDKITVYAEMIKMIDVEDEIEAYFGHFEKMGVQVILSKFNRFINLLDERRVSDLTPLNRDFCWHLARDIYITAEGKIPVCRQDLYAQKKFYSLEKEGYSGAFRSNEIYHECSIRLENHKIPMPCSECDEWYTFLG